MNVDVFYVGKGRNLSDKNKSEPNFFMSVWCVWGLWKLAVKVNIMG